MKKLLTWPAPLLQKWLLSLLLCLPFLAAAIVSAFSGDRTFLILSALLLLFCGIRCAELYVLLVNERYLRAVERYCSHAYLRRFSFSTVAYRAMQQSIVSWKRGESRRRQAEEAYCALCGRRETVCDAELSEAYFFSELQECGTPQQAAFALLRLHGYSIAEIAARYKLDPRRVRRMLKSLYSAYLRFRGDGKEAKK